MSLLVEVNLLEIGIEGVLKASLDEVIVCELGEALSVECTLEVFEG